MRFIDRIKLAFSSDTTYRIEKSDREDELVRQAIMRTERNRMSEGFERYDLGLMLDGKFISTERCNELKASMKDYKF